MKVKGRENQEMKYLVLLDCNSSIGSIYANGNNDGIVNDGDINHPVLACTEIETNNPYYIFAIRSGDQEGGLRQSVFLPHSSVVAIYRYAEDEPHPLGF